MWRDDRALVEDRIVAEGVHKAFGDNKVLKGVSFTVPQGSATTIIGPSGSGKTTLLRALNALDVPDAGVIRVGDVEMDFSKPVSEGPAAAVPGAERLCVPVAQPVSAQDGAAERHRGPGGRAEAAEGRGGGRSRRAARPGRSGREARPVPVSSCPAASSSASASRGRWRCKPKVVLFDEPTSALDPELVGEVLSVIRDLAVEGWTLVIVTHEIQFARQVSDQVLFTDRGVILEKGPPAEVIGNPKEERTRQFLDRILNPL